MTRQFQVYLNPAVSSITYSCVHCRAHLADHNDLISKAFQGSQGRAYLFDKVVNVKSANAEDRLLLTGQHRVADLHCAGCNSLLGWKYERAFEASQRYKEGKYIIELAHLIKENRWTESTFPSPPSSGYQSGEATSPVGRPSSVGGQRNDAFAVDSSGDEEAGLQSASTTNQQRQSLNSESGTLRRTIETGAVPDVSFEQTSPQLNPVNMGWNDLPLNNDSFLTPSFSTYEITSARSSTSARRTQPVCFFHPSTTTSAAVPLLSAGLDADSDMAETPLLSANETEKSDTVAEAAPHRPTSLFPPPTTATPSFSTEAVQAMSESVTIGAEIGRDPNEVVFTAAME